MDNNQNDDQERHETKHVRMIRLRFHLVGEFHRAIDAEQSIEAQRW